MHMHIELCICATIIHDIVLVVVCAPVQLLDPFQQH